jgi:threonyl-tRNA synthetase
MMPEQVRVLPITDRAHDYAKDLAKKMNDMGICAETDCRSEKLGYKIREAQLQKVPYMLVVGDRDMENGTVSPRHRADGDLGAMSFEDFTALLKDVVDSKAKK